MEKQKKTFGQRDFRERFEFRLTVNDIIFCQRYFKINDFNPTSLRSYDLMDTIRYSANLINRDLKLKTQTFLEYYTPRIFNSVKEMNDYFMKPKNKDNMSLGESILIKDEKEPNYFWDGTKPMPCENRYEDKELTQPLTENEIVTYKFSFLDSGKEVCSVVWDGIYPKTVRNSIDLSNKKFKTERNITKENMYQIGFEDYIRYKMFEDKPDLIYNIIKDICTTCCQENSWYQTSETFTGKNGKKITYKNPKIDDESIQKELTKRFEKFYK